MKFMACISRQKRYFCWNFILFPQKNKWNRLIKFVCTFFSHFKGLWKSGSWGSKKNSLNKIRELWNRNVGRRILRKNEWEIFFRWIFMEIHMFWKAIKFNWTTGMNAFVFLLNPVLLRIQKMEEMEMRQWNFCTTTAAAVAASSKHANHKSWQYNWYHRGTCSRFLSPSVGEFKPFLCARSSSEFASTQPYLMCLK